jgi:tripartite-type tricarboxylate transporter receptor subunit TctC
VPHAQAGAVRALAVTSEQRLAIAPDLPTIGETIKGFSVSAWQGLFAPAGTPRPIVERLAAEVKHVFEEPGVVTALTKVGGKPAPMSADEFTAFIASERPKWQQVVKAAGVHLDAK